MLSSGPRSYYDEYARKKGMQRVVQDPSSLLTDRIAYTNFLEVQLERVSAACLAAQAYEDRFNDMQAMVKALEQRCASNVKLISLAQQCTEEVRSESDHKLNLVIKQQQDDRKIFEKSINILSQQEQTLERAVGTIPLLDSRLLTLEKVFLDQENKIDHHYKHFSQLFQSLSKKYDELEHSQKDSFSQVDSLHTRINQFSYTMEENQSTFESFREDMEKKISHQLTNFEMKYDSSMKFLEEAVNQKLISLEKNLLTNQNDSLSMIKQHYNTLSSEFHTHKSSLQEDMLHLKSNLDDQVQQSLQSFQEHYDHKLDELNALSTQQLQQVHSLEEELIQFCEKTDVFKQELASKQSELELKEEHAYNLYEQQLSFLNKQFQDLREQFNELDSHNLKSVYSMRSKGIDATGPSSSLFKSGSRDSQLTTASSLRTGIASKKSTVAMNSNNNSGHKTNSSSRSNRSVDDRISSQMRSLTIDDMDEQEQVRPFSDSEIALGSSSIRKSRSGDILPTSTTATNKKLKKTVSYRDEATASTVFPSALSFDRSSTPYSPSRGGSAPLSRKSSARSVLSTTTTPQSPLNNNENTSSYSLNNDTNNEEVNFAPLNSEDILSSLDNYSQHMASYLREQMNNNNEGSRTIGKVISKYNNDRQQIFQK
jgi:DNA repair exonuclease SbcCD ATPase subunit